ncbi:hypothetical protein DEO72_LG3g2349 [Vigna unguiculata]|uniref:Uncharacterized protein n=1 Tax=Vigna unguiculata TaxID=3917 RepID=A0A4D6LGN4_VIGUN|nr:hypothetical protein DEO72_LG3g2349 [Vigna unguiculata]
MAAIDLPPLSPLTRCRVVKASVDPVSRRTVARPVTLAQASQSRLGEMNRDSPRTIFERATLAEAKGARLSETLQPERGVGRGSALFGRLFVLG